MCSKMELTDDNIMKTVVVVYNNYFVFKKPVVSWFVHHNYDFSTERRKVGDNNNHTYFLVADEDVLVHFKLEWL